MLSYKPVKAEMRGLESKPSKYGARNPEHPEPDNTKSYPQSFEPPLPPRSQWMQNRWFSTSFCPQHSASRCRRAVGSCVLGLRACAGSQGLTSDDDGMSYIGNRHDNPCLVERTISDTSRYSIASPKRPQPGAENHSDSDGSESPGTRRLVVLTLCTT